MRDGATAGDAASRGGRKEFCRGGRTLDVPELSTVVMLAGAGLFVLPIPGTFILGGLVMFVGIGLYLFRDD